LISLISYNNINLEHSDNKDFDISESVIICGEPRSGSTWLMELLKNIPGMVTNWEPLHPGFGVVPHEFRWGDRPYLPENETSPEFVQLMTDILTLKTFSEWTLRYTTLNDYIQGRRVLTKFVRANLLLPWLTNYFIFKHKPIFIIRHPIAVTLSQFNSFKSQKRLASRPRIPDCINNERFITHFDYLKGLETKLERNIALWCLNNMMTINHPAAGDKWQVVHYEHLLMDPLSELTRLLGHLQIDADAGIFKPHDLRKESAMVSKISFQNDPAMQLEKWKVILTDSELLKIQKVFNFFGLKLYSAFEALPVGDQSIRMVKS